MSPEESSPEEAPDPAAPDRARTLFDGRRLGRRVEVLLRDLGVAAAGQVPAAAALRLFLGLEGWFRRSPGAATATRLEGWLRDGEVRRFLGVHDFDGVTWFRCEGFRCFLWWLLATAAADLRPGPAGGEVWERSRSTVEELLAAEAASGYRLDGLVAAVPEQAAE